MEVDVTTGKRLFRAGDKAAVAAAATLAASFIPGGEIVSVVANSALAAASAGLQYNDDGRINGYQFDENAAMATGMSLAGAAVTNGVDGLKLHKFERAVVSGGITDLISTGSGVGLQYYKQQAGHENSYAAYQNTGADRLGYLTGTAIMAAGGETIRSISSELGRQHKIEQGRLAEQAFASREALELEQARRAMQNGMKHEAASILQGLAVLAGRREEFGVLLGSETSGSEARRRAGNEGQTDVRRGAYEVTALAIEQGVEYGEESAAVYAQAAARLQARAAANGGVVTNEDKLAVLDELQLSVPANSVNWNGVGELADGLVRGDIDLQERRQQEAEFEQMRIDLEELNRRYAAAHDPAWGGQQVQHTNHAYYSDYEAAMVERYGQENIQRFLGALRQSRENLQGSELLQESEYMREAYVDLVAQQNDPFKYLGAAYGVNTPILPVREILSIMVGFTPVVGTGQAVAELVAGYDYIADHEVSRTWAAVGLALSMVPGGKGGSRLFKLLRATRRPAVALARFARRSRVLRFARSMSRSSWSRAMLDESVLTRGMRRAEVGSLRGVADSASTTRGAVSTQFLVSSGRVARYQNHLRRLQTSGYANTERLAEFSGRVQMMERGYLRLGSGKLPGSLATPGRGAGRHGIDAVYYKHGDPTNLAVLESKFRAAWSAGRDPLSLLHQTARSGRQMSPRWIDSNVNRLLEARHGVQANHIGEQLTLHGYQNRFLNVLEGRGGRYFDDLAELGLW